MISPYVADLAAVKILSKEEERVAYIKYRDTGCVDSKRRLIESNLRLVFSIARNYTKDNSEEMLENLISAGNEGLIKALDKYDPTKGAKFSTYCGSWVLMYIRKYVLEDMQLIRAPSSVRRRARMADAKRHAIPRVSSSIFFQLEDTTNTPAEDLESRDLEETVRVFLKEAISWLPPREGKIVSHYYGVTAPRQSLQQLGDQLNLSSERIRQLRNKAELKLRGWLPLFGLESLIEFL